MFLASSFLIFAANRFAMLHVIFHKQLRSRDSNAVASGGAGGALAPPKKFCQVAKVFFCCYPSILTGKTPNFMLIIFYTMRNVAFLVIKATL